MMPLFFFMKENQLSVFICVNLWQKNRVIRGSRGKQNFIPLSFEILLPNLHKDDW